MAFQVTTETYKEWMVEQRRRLDELEQKSVFEKKVVPKEKLKTIVVTSAGVITESDDQLVDKLSNIWGPIGEII